jgi:hypothetical protein
MNANDLVKLELMRVARTLHSAEMSSEGIARIMIQRLPEFRAMASAVVLTSDGHRRQIVQGALEGREL